MGYNLKSIPAFLTIPKRFTSESSETWITHQSTAHKISKIISDPWNHDLKSFRLCSFKNYRVDKDEVKSVFAFAFVYENATEKLDKQIFYAARANDLHYISYFLDRDTVVYIFTFPKTVKFEKWDWKKVHNGFALRAGLPGGFTANSWMPWREHPIIRGLKQPFALYAPTFYKRLNVDAFEEVA